MLGNGDGERLRDSYEKLRERLLDMTLRNPMLSYKHRPTSRRQLQVIDEVPEEIFRLLVIEATPIEIVPLPEPDDVPADEKTAEFSGALSYAKATDVKYLDAVREVDASGRDDAEAALARAERALRDRLRVQCGMHPVDRAKAVDPVQHARDLGIDPSFELKARADRPGHRDRRLQTLKLPRPLDALLEKMRADAKLAEQETGLSTLFLVFGFLEWCEQDEGKKLLAPLLMLPVHLEAKRSAKGKVTYELSAISTAAEDNLSLRKRVENDFGLSLPKADADVDSTMSVEMFLSKVSSAVEHLRGWRVRRQLTLGHFVFGRFAMYADLDPARWTTHPTETGLVGAVIRGTDRGGDPAGGFGDAPDYPIDDATIEAKAPYLIHDADASQHSALVDAMDGRNLVVQGPPGTGKSQTITNLIANALAAGRTVLFLAEKQAALDVVKRRLDTAGLGHFCLELHSDKATPRIVVDNLKQRFKLGYGNPPPPPPTDAIRESCRTEVSAYVAALHSVAADGATPFDLMWKAIRSTTLSGKQLEAFKGVEIPQADRGRLGEIDEARDALALYAKISAEFTAGFGPPGRSAWGSVSFGAHVSPGNARDLVEDLGPFHAAAAAAAVFIVSIEDLGIRDAIDLRKVAAAARGMPRRPPSPELLLALHGHSVDEIHDCLRNLSREFELREHARADPLPAGMEDAQFGLVDALAGIVGHDARFPAAIFSDAERTRKEVQGLLQAIANAEAFLLAMGFGTWFPSEGLAAVTTAARCIANMPADIVPWFAWSPIDDFDGAFERWKALAGKEADWRARFPNVESAWPHPADIRATAGLLRKGLLSRTFGLGRDKQPVAEMAARLGMPNLGAGHADGLDALAAHLEAVAAFASDRSFERMFGAAWAGLNTPFEPARHGQQLRGRAMSEIRACPHGDGVADHIGGFTAEEVAWLTPLAAETAAKGVSVGTSFVLITGSIDQAKAGLAEARAGAERILMADAGAALEPFHVSLSRLIGAVGIERERRMVREGLRSSPVWPSVEHLIQDSGTLPHARAAASWIEAVEVYADLPTIRAGLLSTSSEDMRDRLQNIALESTALVDRLEAVRGDLRQRYGLDGLSTDDPKALLERLRVLSARRDEFAAYVDLRRQRRELGRLGLEPFVDRAEAQEIDPHLLPDLFSALLSRTRATAIRRSDPVLSQAVGSRLQSRREVFVKRDRDKIEADRSHVRDLLLARRPLPGHDEGSKATWTESALLRNEMMKQKRFAPIRELMRRASLSLQQMTPCFMMSPLSLAKFLPGGQVNFDLLVIDEASQMRPEDALGGLLRATQVVVVGDPKQLPPSDFFKRSEDADGVAVDEEDKADEMDDESILESCNKAFRDARLLRWHYRSRCESLIAFSNREFYRDELITFPSPRPGSFSVEMLRVPGRYEARRNAIEGQFVAEEAILFMRHHADSRDLPSLGVIAVNGDQRDLVDEEVKRLSADDDLVLRYRERVAERGEPFFVKNLENVQGDERDFVFVSMTYGPSAPGLPVAQRFGPIAGKHGHRRLNVLFTRARLRIALFASFGSADVRPSDESPNGVRVLKRYFEYAERRGYAETRPGSQADSDFEVEVARRLEASGFEVDYQVGVSGFRIDLGIRHPDHPERFIAGVECDGARYHSSKSARDRDRLREEILTGLGWTILRVWSTDWFDNPDLQTRNLVSRLNALRARPAPDVDGYRIAATLKPATGFGEAMPAEPVLPVPVRGGEEPAEIEHTPTSAPPLAPDAASLMAGDGPLDVDQLRAALRAFRDRVIASEMEDWEPHRSILRETMVETFVVQRLDEAEHWFKKVPNFQRIGTSPDEKRRYLDRICDLVGRLDGEARPPSG